MKVDRSGIAPPGEAREDAEDARVVDAHAPGEPDVQARDVDTPPAETRRRPTLGERLWRPFQNLRQRVGTPRYDAAIGPFSLSSSRTAPPPVIGDPPQIFDFTTRANRRGLRDLDGKLHDAAAKAAGLLAGSVGGKTPPATATASALTPPAAPGDEREQLIATAVRTVTADPAEARRVHEQLRLIVPTALEDLRDARDDESLPSSAASLTTRRLAHAAQRALASTAGGFDALLHLQRLSLPEAGQPGRAEAERRLEHYKLALRAEDALIAMGLPVGGSQSTLDVRLAIERHPGRDELLDASLLGTGNARRRPGGPHEAEARETLAAQAFLHATRNLRRAPGDPVAHPEFKPAYVALRNGFTASGQGSDFHLMAKRLRKFVTYIDLACKTPDGQALGRLDRARAPVRALRRLAGKDKSPLSTLLKAGPIGARLRIKTLRGEFDTGRDMKALQAAFDAGSPSERRDILRQLVAGVAAGGLGSYSDARRHGVGLSAGTSAIDVANLGGASLGVSPVVEASAERTRTAMLRAVHADTGVLYLGSEKKLNGSVGVGARAGAGLGPIANVSAQAMARLGGSHLVAKGLMIRTRKEGTDHEGLSPEQAAGLQATGWKRMGELVVNTVFQIADQAKAARPAHGGAMWSRMVEALGDFRDISFGWNEAKASSADVSVSLDATASAQLAPGVGASASAGVGLKHAFLDRKTARDVAGAARTVQTEQGERTVFRAGAGAGIGHPAVPLPGGRSLALFGRHRVGVETELVLQSRNGLVRIATEDGRVRPELSVRHREFGVRDDFIRVMNAQRERWAAHLGGPAREGGDHSGERRYDDFMRRLANLPTGPARLFLERECLTPQAADAINARMDRLAMLQRPPPAGTAPDPDAPGEVARLRRQIAELVEEPSHWRPTGLVVLQPLQASLTGVTGLEAGVTAQSAGGDVVDRLLGGGKLSIGARTQAATGAQVLLSLDVAAAPDLSPALGMPLAPTPSAMPDAMVGAMHAATADAMGLPE